MRDAYITTLERLRENRTAHTSNAVDRLATAEENDAAARGTFPAGTRVLDRESGGEGVVIYTALSLSSLTAKIGVRLDSGVVVERAREDLLVRPTPPAVP